MDYTGFLNASDRAYLHSYIKRRKAAGLSIRRANALLALDKGYKFALVCDIFEIGDTTLREWLSAFEQRGVAFLVLNGYSAREGHLSHNQAQELCADLRKAHRVDTNEIRAHIAQKYGVDYSRSGCIKLLHRLGFSYKKPKLQAAQADVQAQQDFIKNYAQLLNKMDADEAVYFADAAHPDHQVRPAFGWFHKDDKPTVPSNSGRKRVNIHAAVCLENFDTPFVEVEKVNADSTIALFQHLEARNPHKRLIHVILDNAKYHHAKKVQAWLDRPDCRIRLIWLPSYAPHLNSIERLWGVMHKHVTHNKFYKTYNEFANAILTFLKETIPKNWKQFRDQVTDNFRIISNDECKFIAGIR